MIHRSLQRIPSIHFQHVFLANPVPGPWMEIPARLQKAPGESWAAGLGVHISLCVNRSAHDRVKDLPTAPLLRGHVHVEAVTAARADYVCASA